MRRRRLLLGSLAALLAGAGVLAVLLAVDVGRWQGAFAADDLRFRNAPTQTLWSPSTILPAGLTRSVLGVDGELAYRHALQQVRLARPHEVRYSNARTQATRGEAQLELLRIAHGDPSAARRAAAENLLGGLAFAAAAPTQDDTLKLSLLQTASDSFRSAIELEPDNADAKYNLELALFTLDQENAQVNRNSGPTRNTGTGAGAAGTGSGY